MTQKCTKTAPSSIQQMFYPYATYSALTLLSATCCPALHLTVSRIAPPYLAMPVLYCAALYYTADGRRTLCTMGPCCPVQHCNVQLILC